MASEEITLEQARALLFHEAHCLDTRDWDGWLALYAQDACFWLPTWVDEHLLAWDSQTQLSLMYYDARTGLEDRVMRVRSGQSVASAVLPRTVHAVNNVQMAEEVGGTVLRSVFSVHLFEIKSQSVHVNFGRYEHRLKRVAGQWLISQKKIVLMNDMIPTMLDFYCV
jgi:3-phenylpropionate/cinnamic acid dioxygenase small subunit